MAQMEFNTEAEARAYMGQNPGAQMSFQQDPQVAAMAQQEQQDPYRQQLEFLFNLAKSNPDNQEIGNAYIGALSDYYNPQGSQYQAQQEAEAKKKEEDLAFAKLLMDSTDPTVAAQGVELLKPYLSQGKESAQTGFDPYSQFKSAQNTNLQNYITGDNYSASNPTQVKEASTLSKLSQLTPQQYQQYMAPIGFGEKLGYNGISPFGALAQMFGMNNDQVRRQRLNLGK